MAAKKMKRLRLIDQHRKLISRQLSEVYKIQHYTFTVAIKEKLELFEMQLFRLQERIGELEGYINKRRRG